MIRFKFKAEIMQKIAGFAIKDLSHLKNLEFKSQWELFFSLSSWIQLYWEAPWKLQHSRSSRVFKVLMVLHRDSPSTWDSRGIPSEKPHEWEPFHREHEHRVTLRLQVQETSAPPDDPPVLLDKQESRRCPSACWHWNPNSKGKSLKWGEVQEHLEHNLRYGREKAHISNLRVNLFSNY